MRDLFPQASQRSTESRFYRVHRHVKSFRDLDQFQVLLESQYYHHSHLVGQSGHFAPQSRRQEGITRNRLDAGLGRSPQEVGSGGVLAAECGQYTYG